MSFYSSESGRACLNDWDRPLTINHIVNLLLDLRRPLSGASIRVIAVIVVRESVPTPDDDWLNCLQASLPAILDCCEHLLVVIEGETSDRSSIRTALRTTRRTATKRTPPRTFDELSAAFSYAQPFAPHDVLELQRQTMRHSLSPCRRLG